MGIHANYLYRVMPTLESEGLVVKRDRGWHPASLDQAEVLHAVPLSLELVDGGVDLAAREVVDL